MTIVAFETMPGVEGKLTRYHIPPLDIREKRDWHLALTEALKQAFPEILENYTSMGRFQQTDILEGFYNVFGDVISKVFVTIQSDMDHPQRLPWSRLFEDEIRIINIDHSLTPVESVKEGPGGILPREGCRLLDFTELGISGGDCACYTSVLNAVLAGISVDQARAEQMNHISGYGFFVSTGLYNPNERDIRKALGPLREYAEYVKEHEEELAHIAARNYDSPYRKDVRGALSKAAGDAKPHLWEFEWSRDGAKRIREGLRSEPFELYSILTK